MQKRPFNTANQDEVATMRRQGVHKQKQSKAPARSNRNGNTYGIGRRSTERISCWQAVQTTACSVTKHYSYTPRQADEAATSSGTSQPHGNVAPPPTQHPRNRFLPQSVRQAHQNLSDIEAKRRGPSSREGLQEMRMRHSVELGRTKPRQQRHPHRGQA